MCIRCRVTSFKPDSSNWKRMGTGIFSLILSFEMTRSFALFDIMKADTFLEMVLAKEVKEVKAGGSDNKEHPIGTGLGTLAVLGSSLAAVSASIGWRGGGFFSGDGIVGGFECSGEEEHAVTRGDIRCNGRIALALAFRSGCCFSGRWLSHCVS